MTTARDVIDWQRRALAAEAELASLMNAGALRPGSTLKPSAASEKRATKPKECEVECPPKQVCDYCQLLPDYRTLMDRAFQAGGVSAAPVMTDEAIFRRFQKWTLLLDQAGAAEFWDDIDWLRKGAP